MATTRKTSGWSFGGPGSSSVITFKKLPSSDYLTQDLEPHHQKLFEVLNYNIHSHESDNLAVITDSDVLLKDSFTFLGLSHSQTTNLGWQSSNYAYLKSNTTKKVYKLELHTNDDFRERFEVERTD